MKINRSQPQRKPTQTSDPSLSLTIERLTAPRVSESEGIGLMDRALKSQPLETQRRMVRWAMDLAGIQEGPARASEPNPGTGWVDVSSMNDRSEGRRVYQEIGVHE